MIMRCPCCNARLTKAVNCSRCKADLRVLIQSEKAAQFWLNEAIHSLAEENTEQSIVAIKYSLQQNKTKAALVFCEFLINQQCEKVLDLLAESQLLLARELLYQLRALTPYSKKLHQLDGFTNYLLIKEIW